METTICIPTWDTDRTVACTLAIVDRTLSLTNDLSLVVVDNASPSDAARSQIRERARHDPRLVLIENRENGGVGPGYNQGLAWGYAHGSRYFVCLNSDVRFEDPRWLDALLAPLRGDARQLAGLRYIGFNGLLSRDGQAHPYLEGFCLAMERVFLDEVGYFDEEFAPAWVEEVELAWRARSHGYTLCAVDTPHVHPDCYSANESRLLRDVVTLRNLNLFFRKVREGRNGRLGWSQ